MLAELGNDSKSYALLVGAVILGSVLLMAAFFGLGRRMKTSGYSDSQIAVVLLCFLFLSPLIGLILLLVIKPDAHARDEASRAQAERSRIFNLERRLAELEGSQTQPTPNNAPTIVVAMRVCRWCGKMTKKVVDTCEHCRRKASQPFAPPGKPRGKNDLSHLQ